MGANGGSLTLKVLNVEKRHNVNYKGKIFFRARAINKCDEPGDWSDPVWFYPHTDSIGEKNYDRLTYTPKNWDPVKQAQCQKETGEANTGLMSAEDALRLNGL